MTSVFLRALNMSLAACVVILVIMLARMLLRRAPKKWSYLLWLAAAFRLCCPVSIGSAFSLFNLSPIKGSAAAALPAATQSAAIASPAPAAQALATAIPQLTAPPEIPRATAAVTQAVQAMQTAYAPMATSAPVMPTAEAAAAAPTVNIGELLLKLGAALWLVGAAAMLSIGIIRFISVRRKTLGAVPMEGERGVYISEVSGTPFILGLFRPRIYVPSGLSGGELAAVLAHERCHIKRGDHIVKVFAYLLLSVHWFDPLCWVAFRLMSRDMEMSCDERVLEAGFDAADYGGTILSFAVQRRFPAPEPIAFGESDASKRIKNVLGYKKPKRVITVIVALLCCALMAACSFNAKQSAAGGPDANAEAAPVPAVNATGPAADDTAEPDFTREPFSTPEPSPAPGPTEGELQLPLEFDTVYLSEYEAYHAAARALLAGEPAENTGFASSRQYVWFVLEEDGLKAYSKKTVHTTVSESFETEVSYQYDGLLAVFPREVGELANRRLCEYANEYVFYDTDEDTCLIDEGLLGDNWFALVTLDESMQDLQAHCLFCFDGGEWKEIAGNNGGLYIDGSDYGASQTIFGACVVDAKTAYVNYFGKWLWSEENGYTKPYVYRTTDGGASWRRLDITLPESYLSQTDCALLSPVFEGSHGVMLIAGLLDGRMAWLETFDSGLTWEYRANGVVTAFAGLETLQVEQVSISPLTWATAYSYYPSSYESCTTFDALSDDFFMMLDSDQRKLYMMTRGGWGFTIMPHGIEGPRDAAFWNGNYAILGSKMITVFDRDGKVMKSVHLPKGSSELETAVFDYIDGKLYYQTVSGEAYVVYMNELRETGTIRTVTVENGIAYISQRGKNWSLDIGGEKLTQVQVRADMLLAVTETASAARAYICYSCTGAVASAQIDPRGMMGAPLFSISPSGRVYMLAFYEDRVELTELVFE